MNINNYRASAPISNRSSCLFKASLESVLPIDQRITLLPLSVQVNLERSYALASVDLDESVKLLCSSCQSLSRCVLAALMLGRVFIQALQRNHVVTGPFSNNASKRAQLDSSQYQGMRSFMISIMKGLQEQQTHLTALKSMNKSSIGR